MDKKLLINYKNIIKKNYNAIVKDIKLFGWIFKCLLWVYLFKFNLKRWNSISKYNLKIN